MRTFGFASVLLGICVIVSGCEKHLTPQQAEVLLTKTYSSPLSTAHFTCQEGEREATALSWVVSDADGGVTHVGWPQVRA